MLQNFVSALTAKAAAGACMLRFLGPKCDIGIPDEEEAFQERGGISGNTRGLNMGVFHSGIICFWEVSQNEKGPYDLLRIPIHPWGSLRALT